MNTRDSYEKRFMKAIKDGNVAFTYILHKECTEQKFDADGLLKTALKTYAITECSNLTTTQQFIEFSIKIAKKSLISTAMPALLLSHIFDIMPVHKCKDYFVTLLEEQIETWREDAFFNNAKGIILRLCNNLLAKLSTVEQANLRGRVMIFVSCLFPFYERSGCNVDMEYNTELLGIKSESSFNTESASVNNLNFDNFKLLQKYLNEPDKCVTKQHWDTFLKCTNYVLNFFVNNDLKEEQSSSTISQSSGKIEFTNTYLRDSVYNCKFRRQILLQILMIYQYLSSKVLNEKQLEAMNTNAETIYKILRTTPPNGEAFVSTIKNMLETEKRWTAWKSSGCPERPAPASKKLNVRPRKRQLGDILKEQAQLTGEKGSLQSVSHPITLEDCKSEKRNFVPTLTGYLREAADQLKPECTIPERYKKIYGGNFGWSALRLLASQSNRFYDYTTVPKANKAEFLKMMFSKVLVPEPDSAEVTDDRLEDAACASTSKGPITNADPPEPIGKNEKSIEEQLKLLGLQVDDDTDSDS